MIRHPADAKLRPAQRVAEKVFSAFERFLHVEALSGIVLLTAAAAALVWANSPAAHSYHHLWETVLALNVGPFAVSTNLHFLINDVLMTVFFLVVGMEIRREMQEGTLSEPRAATLPLAAALGGVAVPAILFMSIASQPKLLSGWAVPTATDIAFAVGVLALLGKSIPSAIRIFLLALAIIDDIAAVIIIALFYSGGIDLSGVFIISAGLLLVLGLQAIGVGTAYAYVIPAAIVWYGLLKTGAHPTLAGVMLGLLTPVAPMRMRDHPFAAATHALGRVRERASQQRPAEELAEPLKELRIAQRELLPPVTRVQRALHPWVAFGIMPLFALANAGVSLSGIDVRAGSSQLLVLAVAVALVCGKPLGIVAGSWMAVRAGWCELPRGMSWREVWLVGCLGGIGFTMSIFIATLAFTNVDLLGAAKLGVLLGSLTAGVLGLAFGRWCVKRAVSTAT